MITNVQVLRCVAALGVVLTHTQGGLHSHANLPIITLVGSQGVDVFFVISGFIMVHTTWDRSRGWAAGSDFWINRIIRVVPLYWMATLATAVLCIIGLIPYIIDNISSQHLLKSLAFFPEDRLPVLSVGWTLVYEMYFYFLFGLALLIRSQTSSTLFLSVLMTVSVASWSLANEPHTPVGRLAYPIIIEFVMGMLLGLGLRYLRQRRIVTSSLLGHALLWIGTAFMIYGGTVYGMSLYPWTFLRLAVAGVPAAMIVAGALLLEHAGQQWNSRTLLLLGAASYAIYLIHAPVVEIFVQAAVLFVSDPGQITGMLIGAAAILFAITTGVGVHLFVEKPLQHALKSWARTRTKTAPLAS